MLSSDLLRQRIAQLEAENAGLRKHIQGETDRWTKFCIDLRDEIRLKEEPERRWREIEA